MIAFMAITGLAILVLDPMTRPTIAEIRRVLELWRTFRDSAQRAEIVAVHDTTAAFSKGERLAFHRAIKDLERLISPDKPRAKKE